LPNSKKRKRKLLLKPLNNSKQPLLRKDAFKAHSKERISRSRYNR